MAKIDRYREVVKQVIRDHTRHQLAYGEIETQTIFDTEGDHYQLVHAGLIHVAEMPVKVVVDLPLCSQSVPANLQSWRGTTPETP